MHLSQVNSQLPPVSNLTCRLFFEGCLRVVLVIVGLSYAVGDCGAADTNDSAEGNAATIAERFRKRAVIEEADVRTARIKGVRYLYFHVGNDRKPAISWAKLSKVLDELGGTLGSDNVQAEIDRRIQSLKISADDQNSWFDMRVLRDKQSHRETMISQSYRPDVHDHASNGIFAMNFRQASRQVDFSPCPINISTVTVGHIRAPMRGAAVVLAEPPQIVNRMEGITFLRARADLDFSATIGVSDDTGELVQLRLSSSEFRAYGMQGYRGGVRFPRLSSSIATSGEFVTKAEIFVVDESRIQHRHSRGRLRDCGAKRDDDRRLAPARPISARGGYPRWSARFAGSTIAQL
jgi:hypothetical protein